jgi:hypothetical protein
MSDYSSSLSAPYPSGSVPLGSPFYLERSPIEAQIYEEVRKPGALIRIKGPKEMGKTSLLLRTLDYGNHQGYHTVSLSLEQVDEAILNDLNRFLRWLCATISLQLQIDPKLDNYWDEDIGSKISCTLYFRGYLLEKLNHPLILALDEVNYIFEHPKVAKDVLPLFRSWYEEAKRQPIWQNLRLIVVHSTEVYVPLQLKQSPFNVGLPIEIGNFSPEQVQELAQRYGLNWFRAQETKQVMALLEGHPALVHLAIYHLSRGEITLKQLLETAPTSTGIYSHHLQRHQATLEEQPELAKALETMIKAPSPVSLDPLVSYKLASMGLLKQSGDRVTWGCELYQRYFAPYEQPPKMQMTRRKRGVILTSRGLEKLQAARTEAESRENSGNRYTLEELSERTNLSVDTLMKVFACETGVDRQTLKICFTAFQLALESSDYYQPDTQPPSAQDRQLSGQFMDDVIDLEIDSSQVKKQVEQITNSEFFRHLKKELREIRQEDDL